MRAPFPPERRWTGWLCSRQFAPPKRAPAVGCCSRIWWRKSAPAWKRCLLPASQRRVEGLRRTHDGAALLGIWTVVSAQVDLLALHGNQLFHNGPSCDRSASAKALQRLRGRAQRFGPRALQPKTAPGRSGNPGCRCRQGVVSGFCLRPRSGWWRRRGRRPTPALVHCPCLKQCAQGSGPRP